MFDFEMERVQLLEKVNITFDDLDSTNINLLNDDISSIRLENDQNRLEKLLIYHSYHSEIVEVVSNMNVTKVIAEVNATEARLFAKITYTCRNTTIQSIE